MLAVSAQNNRPKGNECEKHMLQITFSGKGPAQPKGQKNPADRVGQGTGWKLARIRWRFVTFPCRAVRRTRHCRPGAGTRREPRLGRAGAAAAPGCPAGPRVCGRSRGRAGDSARWCLHCSTVSFWGGGVRGMLVTAERVRTAGLVTSPELLSGITRVAGERQE